MIAKYDIFNRLETPVLSLCPPGTTYNTNTKTLSRCIGVISGTQDEEMIINFNAPSELNFRVYKVVDGTEDERVEMLKVFNAVRKRQLAFIDDIGFFVIESADKSWDENNQIFKDVKATSCESELYNRALPYLGNESDSGITFVFSDLISLIESHLTMWHFEDLYAGGNTIDENLKNKVRSFETIQDNQNILSFLMTDVQDAYECIFLFDILNRTIKIKDQSNFAVETDIHLTHDDYITSLDVSDESDEIYTSMRVVGNENMVISPVNPTGSNVIYDFSYYTEWMTEELANKVTAWQNKIDDYFDTYSNLNLQYYKLLNKRSNYSSENDKLSIQKDVLERCRDNIVAESGLPKDAIGYFVSGSNTDSIEKLVKQYSDYIIQNGGQGISVTKLYADSLEVDNNSAITTYTADEIAHLYIKDADGVYIKEFYESDHVYADHFTYDKSTKKLKFNNGDLSTGTNIAVFYKQSESETADAESVIMIADLLDVVINKIAEVENSQIVIQEAMSETTNDIDSYKNRISEIISANSITSPENFTTEEYLELSNYIYEGNYSDDYVIITDSMDYEARFEQMKILYDRAWSQLRRVSTPTDRITIDASGFIFKKAFSSWANQLETGCYINVEVEPDDVAPLFLSSFEIGFADKEFKLVFANRYKKFDTKTLFENVLGNISKTANTVDYVKDILFPMKEQTNALSNALSDMRTISMGSTLASTDNDVVIDERGYTGRRRLSDGTYSPEQIKIINNAIAFTDDNWESSKTAIGGFDIERTDANGNTRTEHLYGVNAEVLIGDIVLGNELHILGTDEDGNATDIFNVVNNQINARVEKINAITTETGYTFDAKGLKVTSQNNDISTLITNNGMHVTYMSNTGEEEDRLTATSAGVVARDLTAENFLIAGVHARFEKYSDSTDSERVGCFYI